MLKLTQELFGNADRRTEPHRQQAGGRGPGAGQPAGHGRRVHGIFQRHHGGPPRNPRDDLCERHRQRPGLGEPLGVLEAMSYYIIAATAGHDTDSSTTAGAMWALAENPDQFEKLQDNPALIPGLVEESIRWVTPVKHFMRTATADAELDGRQSRRATGSCCPIRPATATRRYSTIRSASKSSASPNKHRRVRLWCAYLPGPASGRLEMRILWEELLPAAGQRGTCRRAGLHGRGVRLRPEARADPLPDALSRPRRTYSVAERGVVWAAIAATKAGPKSRSFDAPTPLTIANSCRLRGALLAISISVLSEKTR